MTKNRIYLLTLVVVSFLFSCNKVPKENNSRVSHFKLETVDPVSVGFNLDSLKRIDQMLKKYVDKGFIPGASVLIARHGKIAYETVYGYRDREDSIQMEKDDIFRLMSMTKPITSTAVLQLYDAGKLDIQDAVSKYLPEFANPMVLESFNKEDTTWTSRPAKSEITIAQLLTHTSGIVYGVNNPIYDPIYTKNEISARPNVFKHNLDTTIARLGKMPLNFDPGTKYTYGMSTDVLGRVVEVVSGLPLDEYFEKNIFEPLGMTDTWFFSKDSIVEKLVSPYLGSGHTGIVKLDENSGPWSFVLYPTKSSNRLFSGGGGLSGTARDYFRFSQTILNKGELGSVRILQDSTVMLMRTNQIDTLTFQNSKKKFGFGYALKGWEEGNDKAILSWGGAFHTTFWIDPKSDMIVIYLSQVLRNRNAGKIYREFGSLVSSSLVDKSK